MSFFYSFLNPKNKDSDDKVDLPPTQIAGVTDEIAQLLSSGMPVRSKDGYFWDIHKHPHSLQLIAPFLPRHHEGMCHMELYNYLRNTGILSQVCIDNFVTNYINKYPDKSKFILDIAYSVSNTVINNPRLSYIYPQAPMVEVDKVTASLSKENIERVVKNRHLFKNDMDIVNGLGFPAYQHIKHHLYQFENIDMIDVKDRFGMTYDGTISHIFEILYPSVTSHTGSYLFHGSAYYNWYNIILNGLRVPKSGQVQNGSAYGVAIYTGISSQLSLDYARAGNSHYGQTIIGVVQTSGRAAKSTASMKTFEKDSDVTLRYIIVMNARRPDYTVLDSLAKKFPSIPNNKKSHIDLFDMKYDKGNVVAIGEENPDDYIYLDDGEKIYIGGQKEKMEEPPDVPHIVLEDGTILYDQSGMMEIEQPEYILDDDGMDNDNDVPDMIEILLGHLPDIDMEDELDEFNMINGVELYDDDGRAYIILNDGTKIYDETVPTKRKPKKKGNEIVGSNIEEHKKIKRGEKKVHKQNPKRKVKNDSKPKGNDSEYGWPSADVDTHIKRKSKFNIMSFLTGYGKK